MKLSKLTSLFFALLSAALFFAPREVFAVAAGSTTGSGASSRLTSGGAGGTNAGGSSVQPDEFTGAAAYSIPIPVPPARGGIEPQIAITYNSQRKNPNSWVGYGWELEMGAIERTAENGNIDYYDGTSFQVRFNGQTETLELEESNFDAAGEYGMSYSSTYRVDKYRAKIESAYNIYLHLRDYSDPSEITDIGWIVIDKGGRRYYFGLTANSRESTTSCYPWENESSCTEQEWVARWLLEDVYDANNNHMTIQYDGAKFLYQIEYQDITITFNSTYNISGDLNYYPTYREGFLSQVSATARLDDITITQNETTQLMRIAFEYDDYTVNNFRYLTQITQYGADDADSLPPTIFDYFEDDDLEFSSTSLVYTANSTESSAPSYNSGFVDGYYNQFIDMNGDGLVDSVSAYDGDDHIYVYYNTGGDFEYVAGQSEWADPVDAEADCPYTDDSGRGYCYGKLNSHVRYVVSSETATTCDSDVNTGYHCQWLYLMDVNGDSLPDRVKTTAISGIDNQADFTIYINNGHGFETTPVVWRDPHVGDWPGLTNNVTHSFIDMNGDGLVDRVIGVGTEGKFSVYYNTGAGFEQTAVDWDDVYTYIDDDACVGRVSDSAKCTIKDFNGDGLPDRIARAEIVNSSGVSSGFGYAVFLNRNGMGWAKPSTSTLDGEINGVDILSFVDPVTDEERQGYMTSQHDLIDINGDGFLDLVDGDEDAATFTVYYYQGMTYGTTLATLGSGVTLSDPVSDSGESDSWQATGYLSNSNFYSLPDFDIPRTFVLTMDINGDGFIDRVAATNRTNDDGESHDWKIYPLQVNDINIATEAPSEWASTKINQPPGNLKSVTDGAGNATDIEYMPISWPRDYNSDGLPTTHRFLPFNLNVVNKVFSTDYSLSGSDTDADSLRHEGKRKITYDYFGGNLYVRHAVKASTDASDSSTTSDYFAQFNGFHSVTKTVFKADGETWDDFYSTTIYHQTEGDAKSITDAEATSLYDTGALSHFAYAGKPYKQSVSTDAYTISAEVSSYSVDTTTAGDVNYDCDGQCHPTLSSHQKTYYEGAGSTPRVSSVDYTYDEYGNIASQIFYDGSRTPILEQYNDYIPPTAFDSSLQLRDRPSEQRKELSDVVYRLKQFAYDAAGNPIMEIYCLSTDCTSYDAVTRDFDGNGNMTSETGMDDVEKTFDYDADDLFPTIETVTLPSGSTLATTRDYNRLTGKPDEEYNNENVGKRTEYDDFGRPETEYVIDSSGNETLVKSYTYTYGTYTVGAWNDITLLKTEIIEPKTDYADTYTVPASISYTDGAGGALQQCTYTERGNYRMVQSRTTNGGRTSAQTEPTFVTSCDFESELSSSVRVYYTGKDLQGRVTATEAPSGDATSPVGNITVSYATDSSNTYLVKTTTSIEDNLTKVETFDDSDRLVQMVDVNGGVLVYNYNPIGDLESVSLDGVTMTTMAYDLLGRKTSTTDANMGLWTYEYDNRQRLYKQTDANLNYIIFDYDSIGRIEEKDFYDATGAKQKYETYAYDTGDADHEVTDGELFEVKEYDSTGTMVRASRFGYEADYRRVEKVTREIVDLATFDQTTTYDFRGQVRSVVYPGGEEMHYTYSRVGALEQVCSNSGCDTTTGTKYYSIDPSTAYDEFGALQAESFGNGVTTAMTYYPNSHRMQTRTVSKASTILSQREYEYDIYANIVKLSDPKELRGSGAMDDIEYDDLSRMTSYKPLGAATASTLTYDNQGNVQTNSAAFGSNTYEYSNAAHINAVTKIGDESFAYDANGNMTSDNDRTMVYSSQNQLTSVTMKNGMVIEYDYDYTGARVKKHVTRTDGYAHVVENDTHFLGDAMEIKDDTLILNLYAGDKKIGIKALGTIDELLGSGSASLKQINIKSPVRVATAMPYMLIGVALFLMAAMRPALPPRGGKVAVGRMGVLWQDFRQAFQAFIFALPHHKAAKAISFILVLCFSLEYPIQAAFAADTGSPAGPSQSDATYFYYIHGDHLGSSHLMTEGNSTGGKHSGLFYNQGDLIQRIEYQPFGQEKYVLNPNLQTDPSFTGQKYDIESGLYFYKSRYYNPKIARFIQPDSVNPDPGNSQAYNKYAYVANNPLKYVDPSGHSFWGWFKKLAGAFIGALVAVAITVATLGALGVAGATIGQLLANATLGQLVLAGAVGGAAGGLIGGAITGGFAGAIKGAIFGFATGGLMGGINHGMSQAIGQGATFAVMGALGLGLSVKREGWQGIFTFAASFLGALAGSKVAGLMNSKGGIGGDVAPGEASTDDIIKSLEYGPFNRKFNSVEELMASLKEGDVIFGKRPLSFANSMGGTPATDQFNVDFAHEHVFWMENGVLKDAGFTAEGFSISKGFYGGKVFSESGLVDVISNYRFGPVLHGGNIGAIQIVSSVYQNYDYNIAGPNCQDFSEDIRQGLY